VNVSVSQPVKDLKGKIILDTGLDALEWAKKVPLTGEYLKKKVKFRENPQLMEDLLSVMEIEPYKNILEGWAPNFREWVGEMYGPSIVFEELRFQRTRDPYSYRHVMIITMVGSRMLELWIKAAPTIRKAFQAFLLHDLGKSRISSTILEKTETLNDLERRAIREHPIASFALNAAYWGDVNHLCAEVAFHHHEDRAGKGYPLAIKTNSLILDILGAIDRFDALISDRPFRFKKFTPREAFDLLKKDVDEGRFEGDVLRALIALVRKEKILDLKKIKLGTIGRSEKQS
jgi:HD-GYP domain-containing protein (c-di-GMP phosphodiesterase class II)